MLYRRAQATDAGALADVFYRAVREGAREAYSEYQCAAWAPERPSDDAWRARLEGLDTVLAEGDGRVMGFMSLNPEDGDLDLAFVIPEARGQGISDALYVMLENRARTVGLPLLHTHASPMARSFFGRHGWQTDRANTVERRGVQLSNWIMHKSLT